MTPHTLRLEGKGVSCVKWVPLSRATSLPTFLTHVWEPNFKKELGELLTFCEFVIFVGPIPNSGLKYYSYVINITFCNKSV